MRVKSRRNVKVVSLCLQHARTGASFLGFSALPPSASCLDFREVES